MLCSEDCLSEDGQWFKYEEVGYCVDDCSIQSNGLDEEFWLYRNPVDISCVLRHDCPSTNRNADTQTGTC